MSELQVNSISPSTAGATTITINDSVGTGFSSLFSGSLVRAA